MRKLFSLFLLLFVFLLLPFSAHASEISDDSFINILDFATPNDTNTLNVTLQPGVTSVTFDLPSIINWRYVDCLITYAGGRINSVTATTSPSSESSPVPLTFLVKDSYIRIYGPGPDWTWDKITLHFNVASTSWIVFQSFYVSPLGLITYSARSHINFTGVNLDRTLSYAGTPVHDIFYSSVGYYDRYFVSYVYFDEWRHYDYIDFTLMFNVAQITSIVGLFNGQNIVVDINTQEYSVSGGYYFIQGRIDLRTLKKSIDDVPFLIISGDLNTTAISPDTGANSYQFIEVTGYILISPIDPYISWMKDIIASSNSNTNSILSSLGTHFQSIITNQNSNAASIIAHLDTKFTSLLSALDGYFGSDGSGQAAANNAAAIKDNLTIGLGDASDFVKPGSSEVNRYLDFSGAISPSTLTTTTGFLTAVFDVPVISKVLSLCMLFALAAAILFGKR